MLYRTAYHLYFEMAGARSARRCADLWCPAALTRMALNTVLKVKYNFRPERMSAMYMRLVVRRYPFAASSGVPLPERRKLLRLLADSLH